MLSVIGIEETTQANVHVQFRHYKHLLFCEVWCDFAAELSKPFTWGSTIYRCWGLPAVCN